MFSQGMGGEGRGWYASTFPVSEAAYSEKGQGQFSYTRMDQCAQQWIEVTRRHIRKNFLQFDSGINDPQALARQLDLKDKMGPSKAPIL